MFSLALDWCRATVQNGIKAWKRIWNALAMNGITKQRKTRHRGLTICYVFCPNIFRSTFTLTASTWKPAFAPGPRDGIGIIENGCHCEALIAGQFTWMYEPGLNLYPLRARRRRTFKVVNLQARSSVNVLNGAWHLSGVMRKTVSDGKNKTLNRRRQVGVWAIGTRP